MATSAWTSVSRYRLDQDHVRTGRGCGRRVQQSIEGYNRRVPRSVAFDLVREVRLVCAAVTGCQNLVQRSLWPQ